MNDFCFCSLKGFSLQALSGCEQRARRPAALCTLLEWL